MTDEAPPPDPPPDPETGRSSGPWASFRGLIVDPADRLYIAALAVLGAWSYYVRLGVHGLNSWD